MKKQPIIFASVAFFTILTLFAFKVKEDDKKKKKVSSSAKQSNAKSSTSENHVSEAPLKKEIVKMEPKKKTFEEAETLKESKDEASIRAVRRAFYDGWNEELEDQINEKYTVHSWNLDDDLREEINTQVVALFEESDTLSLTIMDFSRCGSGYRSQVMAGAGEAKIVEGVVSYSAGCVRNSLAKFKYYKASQTVEIAQLETETYMPAKTWIDQYFTAS